MRTTRRRPRSAWLAALLAAGVATLAVAPARAGERLRICATLPDLGALATQIGGERVEVAVLVKPTEDPHFVEAKPSFVKALNQADLFLEVGLDLEIGYAPTLLQNARNPKILPGAPGFLDASKAVSPLEIPTGTVDRSMGDVHPLGNPHYLADPLNGVAVARLIAARLGEIDPAGRPDFERRLAAFETAAYERLVGEPLARKYGAEVPKLALLFQHGKLEPLLEQQGEASLLGGWLGAMARHRGARAVQDHRVWTYFAARFGIDLVGALEPKPGIPPTTSQLAEIVELMRGEGVRIVLASAYYDPRYARFVAEKTNAKVLPMASQVGALPDTGTYLAMVGHNVDQVAAALAVAP